MDKYSVCMGAFLRISGRLIRSGSLHECRKSHTRERSVVSLVSSRLAQYRLDADMRRSCRYRSDVVRSRRHRYVVGQPKRSWLAVRSAGYARSRLPFHLPCSTLSQHAHCPAFVSSTTLTASRSSLEHINWYKKVTSTCSTTHW